MDYKKIIEEEIREIYKLIDTPELVKFFAIQQIQSFGDIAIIKENLLAKNKVEQAVTLFQNITSLEKNYKIIYSQVCILIISSFEANLKKIFEEKINSNPQLVALKSLEDIKITLDSLKESNFNISNSLGTFILNRAQGLNFQDLKAIKRAFEDYLKIKITLDENIEKKICFFLECRHVLVHKNGIVDERFIKNTTSFNANLKSYELMDKINFEKKDIDDLKLAVINLFQQIS